MSFPTSVTKSLFHQIMVIFIPGSLIVIPLVLALYISLPNIGFDNLLGNIETKNVDHFAIYIVTMILIFLAGIILENIGSYIEDTCLDKNLEHKESKESKKISLSAWRFYLFSKCEDSNTRVFHKYIDSIVFRYKLELSLLPALGVFFVEWMLTWGWILIQYQSSRDMSLFFYIFFIALTVLIGWIIWFTWRQAKISCSYLNELRIAFMASTYEHNKNEESDGVPCEECRQIVLGRCKACGQ